MKIVIYVNYTSSEFNNDFKLSNMLIERGHNVFLAVNDEQFDYFRANCDKFVIGLSMSHCYTQVHDNLQEYDNLYYVDGIKELSQIIDEIIK